MELDELDGAGLDGVLRGERRAVLVDFWSPWCAPCRSLRPHLRALADEYRADARVVAVNVEAQPQLRERYQVTGLPTLILFKDGTARHRFTGPTLPAALAAGIEAICADADAVQPASCASQAGQARGGAWAPGAHPGLQNR